MVFLGVLSIFPTAFALVMSFTNFKLGSKAAPTFVGFDNYLALLTNPSMLATFGRTFLILLIALPFQLIVGYLIAKVFYQIRSIKGAGLIRTLYLIPVMLPEIVVGLLFGYMLNPRIGVVNYYLGELGIPKPDWFADPNIALYTVILLIVWQWTPLAAIILYGGLLGVPGDVREAAAIDGAGRIRQVFAIELPLLRKVIGLVILLVGIQLIGTFAAVYITTQGGPGSSTTVLSYEIYQQAFVFFNTGYGSALAIITLIVVTALCQLLVRFVFKEEK
jgi:multiple sugar transport system permease protein